MHSSSREDEFSCFELGVGSGALSIALAHEFPKAHFVASDVSLAALSYAKKNALLNKTALAVYCFKLFL